MLTITDFLKDNGDKYSTNNLHSPTIHCLLNDNALHNDLLPSYGHFLLT